MVAAQPAATQPLDITATRPKLETKALKRPKSVKKEDNRLFVQLPPGLENMRNDLVDITNFRKCILR